MKLALVTTAPSVRSGIGDYTRHLLPYLRELCDVSLFVPPEHSGAGADGLEYRGIDTLDPRAFDQLLYQLGNERNHGFMARMVRTIGGTVMQHDWVLFDMALAAWPALARGGWKGHLLAAREGGWEQARLYLRNWLDRRRERTCPIPPVDPEEHEGVLLGGWHAFEGNGRWTSDHALLRLPGAGCEAVRVTVSSEPGRRVSLRANGAALVQHAYGRGEPWARLEVELAAEDEPVIELRTEGIRVSDEQRRHGDVRRLGTFVERIEWRDRGGSHELDLDQPSSAPVLPTSLSRDRFRLPFNRSVVRFADAFLCHSEYVKERILADRNARTPIGVLPHGAERRWRDEERAETRERLGGPLARWRDDFVVVSFGGVQPHKRVGRVLHAIERARRERDTIRLVVAGQVDGELDPKELARALRIADSVHCTGFLDEEDAWDVLHASDVSVNLRGPTSGGTSGGIYQSLAFARPVIASDAAEQRELPDSCVLKVPLGRGEVDAVARALVELAGDPARRRRLEEAARRYVEDVCHWSHAARRYVELLDDFPPPRVTRRALVALRVRERP